MVCPHRGDAAVAVASFDGGQTWGATQQQALIVNEGTTPCDIRQPGALATGPYFGVDIPRVTFDPALSATAAATFWVVWRGGPGNDICLRSVQAGSGAIVSPGPTTLVPTTRLDGTNTIVGAVSGIIARAAGGLLCVMYADRFTGCSTTPQPINWYSTCSIGASFWSAPSLVWHSDSFVSCFGANLGTSSAPTYLNDDANGTFGFDIAPNGVLWAAVHDTRTSIRVLNGGTSGGTWTTSGPLGSSTTTFGGTDVGQPWLTVDLAGRVGITYYQASTSSTGTQITRMMAVLDSGTWSLPTAVSQPFTPNMAALAVGGIGGIGEFQALTLIDPLQFVDPGQTVGRNSFFAAWTEIDPASTSQYRIEGARVGVMP